MAQQLIWNEDTYVRASETDFLSRWKLSSFFMALIEASNHHAEHLGFGIKDLLARDMVWILSRLKIHFYDFPRVDDKITIQTWPKGIQQKIFFMRDYHVLGSDGHRYASARSAAVLANPNARRMLPPQALGASDFFENDGLNALEESLEKIPQVEGLEERFVARAGYSAIDQIGHVNNTRYIDWISDCYSFEEHKQFRPGWLQINYVNEVKPDEPVALLRGAYPNQENTWYLSGSNLATGAKAFDAAMGWEKYT